MGAVAYTSTLARQKQYFRDVEKEKQAIKSTPSKIFASVKGVLSGWGYKGGELESMTKSIAKNPNATLEFTFEKKTAPVDKSAPLRSFTTVLFSTIFGSAIPVIPFIFFRNVYAGAVAAVILSGITLFCIGYYEAKTTVGSIWRSGLQLLIIGLAAGFAGYLIGHFIGAIPL